MDLAVLRAKTLNVNKHACNTGVYKILKEYLLVYKSYVQKARYENHINLHNA